jgi:hypothetical protein
MKKHIDAKALREKIEEQYERVDLTQKDDEILRRERHSLLVKGLPRPDNASRAQDPQIKEKKSNTLKAYHADPINKETLARAQEKRHSSMDWEEHRKHNARINSDSEVVAKRRANHKKWQESEEGRSAFFEGRKKICKKVKDPNGKIWSSSQEAGLVWFPDKSLERAVKTIRFLIKHNRGWEYE